MATCPQSPVTVSEDTLGDGGQAASAQLSFPTSLAVNSAGELYIADTGNNRIRKVAANGVISTVAGTGTSAYSGDGGQATSAQIGVVNGPNQTRVRATQPVFVATANSSFPARSLTVIIANMRLSILSSFIFWAGIAYGAAVPVPIKSSVVLKPNGAYTITD